MDVPAHPGVDRVLGAVVRRASYGMLVVMTAYWVSVYKQINDGDKVAAYARLAGPALEAAGGTFLARGLPERTYEAGESTRTVIIAFESVEAATAAHDSPAYGEALAALDDGAVRDLRIVDGAR